jgi:branched-chain amino acid aminotransferase
MYLKPTMTSTMLELTRRDEIQAGAELYIRPMYWAEHNSPPAVSPDRIQPFCLCLYRRLSAPDRRIVTRSPYAKPLAVTMPIEAKAGCLYPSNARALVESSRAGFDNCLCAICWAMSPS